MPSLEALRLDIDGWLFQEEYDQQIRLMHQNELDHLTLWYFDNEPDLPPLKKPGKLKKYYLRQVLSNGGGLIEVEQFFAKQFPVIRTIFKFPGEKQQGAPIYVGSLTLPFRDFGFVIKVQAFPSKDWYLREKFVKGMLVNEEQEYDAQKILDRWRQDPYFPNHRFGLLYNLSEAERYDEQFPEHALSRLRSHLKHIQHNLFLDASLQEYPVFKGKHWLRRKLKL